MGETCTQLPSTLTQMQVDSEQTDFNSLIDSARLRLYSILQGILVTVVNLAIASGMETAAHIEKHTTTTAFIDSVAFKLTLFYFLNSFVVPIVAVVITNNSSQLWCASSMAWQIVSSGCALWYTQTTSPALASWLTSSV